MQKYIKIVLLLLFVTPTSLSCMNYHFEEFKNDPLKTRIYTLKNGLKVYMTINKDKPRIQTSIAVKVGSKNDPAETTGLAHYFEHLMFKGTDKFGTIDYAKEKVLLDEIEVEFEKYRTVKDEQLREKIYSKIDSLSYQASKYAIANEYDKLMAAIGSSGSNAYTGYDQTVYLEDIPSNQIENWALVQSERFKNNVVRGFHTELETVYEEKNMTLAQDSRKILEGLLTLLFPSHPYGTQTVLGTQEHLKNPSITNIKNYFKKWYVSNNMAICLSGDFDYENMISIIDQYFGDLLPNKDLKAPKFEKEIEIEKPIEKEIYGLEAPSITMGWKFPGPKDDNFKYLLLFSKILQNGQAGLIDININQEKKVLKAYADLLDMSDYTVCLVQAKPKKNQSLEEVSDLILNEIEKIKKGEFDESLLKAVVNQLKKEEQNILERNSERVNMYIESFINEVDWEKQINFINEISKINKEEIIRFANKYFKNNYAIVKKYQIEKDLTEKISKPKITAILTNRDTCSPFLQKVKNTKVKEIEFVFVDFSEEIKRGNLKNGSEILCTKNITNDIFIVNYIFKRGTNIDKRLPLAIEYINYLGTSSFSKQVFGKKLYSLACNLKFGTGSNQSYISLMGLNENLMESLDLLNSFIYDIKGDKKILEKIKKDFLLSRENDKTNQKKNFKNLEDYLAYGTASPALNVLSDEEITNISSEELISSFLDLFKYKYRILYYGPSSYDTFLQQIDNRENKELLNNVENVLLTKKTENKTIYIAPYDSKQIYMASFSNQQDIFNESLVPIVKLYNKYFGRGMNSIVFQEMREARGLAYSANASYEIPSIKEDFYNYSTFIATQNDKMLDALSAFNSIINNMPISEELFNIAKQSLINDISTDRISGAEIFRFYLALEKQGIYNDNRQQILEKLKTLTVNDIISFHKEIIKGRLFNYAILGNKDELKLDELLNNGYKIVELDQKDIFGY